jgi:hypothetical protein
MTNAYHDSLHSILQGSSLVRNAIYLSGYSGKPEEVQVNRTTRDKQQARIAELFAMG